MRRLLALPRGQTCALLHSGDQGRAWLCADAVAELSIPGPDWAGAWARLEAFLHEHSGQKCVGFLGYDLRDDVEVLPRRIPEDLPLPVLHVAAFAQVEECASAVPPAPPGPLPRVEMRAHVSREGYERKVAQVVEAICAGDIFQANLTQPFSGEFDGDPRLLAWSLLHHSPAPYAGYFETAAGDALLCSSPELFLAVEGRQVRTQPIKGTRPRAADPEADQALLAELLASEKDQAELAMIVDLLRNDLGKVAETGSVQVGPFPEHRSFAQVHHTFATVQATLRPEVGLVELLRATFPCGSITGAPKLRCMEILEELELVRRGIYTGAFGWFGPGPRMCLNVAIRSMVLSRGRLRFNTGGGITADSDPAAEYEETLHKAAGMLRAVGGELRSP